MATVETARLILRPFRTEDIPAYAAIRAKPEVVRFLPGFGPRAAEAQQVAAEAVPRFAAMWSGEPGYGPWAVEERSTGRLIGHCGLRFIPEIGETEILYMLDDTAWGKGYATEGAAGARDYAFEALALPKVIALAKPENHASQRVMVKIGMRREPGFIELFGLQAVQFTLGRLDYTRLKAH